MNLLYTVEDDVVIYLQAGGQVQVTCNGVILHKS